MKEKETIRLFAFPLKLKTPNAYWDNLYGEILKDKRIEAGDSSFWSLLFSFDSQRVIHIHWQNILFNTKWKILMPFKLLISLFILSLAKLRGDRLVWTMHNYRDHETKNAFLDLVSIRFLVAMSDAILVHSLAGQKYLFEKYNRKKEVYIISHGNYVNFYGEIMSSPDDGLIKLFKIKDGDKIFLSLGSIRPYKGIEGMIKVFNSLPDNCKLVVAGRPFYEEHLKKMKSMVKNNNIFFYEKLIPGEELPKFFSIADFSLFNFKEVLTSGSVILSLSYGVPPIVPKIGDLEYIIDDGFNGIIFDGVDGLSGAIEYAIAINSSVQEQMASNALKKVSNVKYSDLARETLRAYNLR